MTPEQFYAQYLPYAQSVSQRTGLDPRLVLAQSALETGYGKSAPNMNFFGIKSHGRKGGSTLSTQEFEGGRMVQQPASFRGYDTPEQSFTDYADFITSNPRYKGVLEADGLEAQIAAMAKSGYATDPDYGSKLASIASRFDPNSPKVIAAKTMGLLGKGPQTATTNTQGAAPMMQQEEEPRGLLGSLGIQKMEEGAAGETGQRFYQRDSFKDVATILAQGFGRMGIMGMEEIADNIAKQRTENKARNKTIEYLRKSGRSDLADAVESGSLGARDAAGILFSKPKDDRTALMKNYEYARQTGYEGSFNDFLRAGGGGGSVVNVGGEQYKIIGDKILIPDSESPAGVRLVDIPGGKSSVEAGATTQRAEAEQEKREQQESVIDNKADQLINMLEKGGTFNLPEAGIGGNLLGKLGVNQEAVTFRNEIKAIQSIIAFDQLAKMRAASKNGAALGSVTERELELLMSAYGSLDQSTDPKILAGNLRDIKRVMGKIENEPAARALYYGGAPTAAQTQSSGVTVGEPYGG